MKSREEIKELIDLLRSEGVTSYEEDGIKLTLLPVKPLELKPFPKSNIRPARDPVFGLTAQDQEDLFNEVLSPPDESI